MCRRYVSLSGATYSRTVGTSRVIGMKGKRCGKLVWEYCVETVENINKVIFTEIIFSETFAFEGIYRTVAHDCTRSLSLLRLHWLGHMTCSSAVFDDT